jgi:hypothetical protein
VSGRPKARTVAFALAVGVTAVLVRGSPAGAYHIPGAEYTGTHAGGGTVTLNVSADGTRVVRFAITGLTSIPGNTCAFSSVRIDYVPGLPISGNAFADLSALVSLTGAFTAKQTVAGSFSFRSTFPSCTTGTTTWTATTTAAPDSTPPDTTLTGGPTGLIRDDSASFSFTSPEAGVTFQCRLDRAAFTACTSPRAAGPLPDGPHRFEVAALDESGNADPTPAAASFTVDTTAPQTTITRGPARRTMDRTPDFRFAASERGSTFECRLDRARWTRCASPKAYGPQRPGAHLFAVRATDRAGNEDPSPALRRFTIASS